MRPPVLPVGPSPLGLPAPAAQPASAPAIPAAEQQLLDFARRAARQAPMLALVLHLSGLRPPAPRPHHRRIARAMLHEVVQRYGGQVLGMTCGDLVLLCPQPDSDPPRASDQGGTAADAASPYELPAFLARLLQSDAPDPERLVSLWPLPGMAGALLAYATGRSVGRPLPPVTAAAVARRQPAGGEREAERGAVDRAAQTTRLEAVATLAEAADVTELLHRRTAVMLPSSAADRGMLQPLFREISFSITALEARVDIGLPARADPYLFRHLAARLDRRLLQALTEARGTGGPLDPEGGNATASGEVATAGLQLHLNLGLAAIASPEFARFAAAGQRRGPDLHGGVEISLMEACADPAAFVDARARLQAAGLRLVLDRVSHLALGLAEIWPLQPDLVKLEWSQAMARLEPEAAGRLDDALSRIGAARLLLLRADTEAAVRWGMARGIRRFQGRHVDAMLAASRLAACPYADACTLRQCSERAEAAGEVGRRFCRNTRLLDAAAPGLAGSSTWVREIA